MFVLKRTYNELFDLFIKEKRGALDLYKETRNLHYKILDLSRKNIELSLEIEYLLSEIDKIKEE